MSQTPDGPTRCPTCGQRVLPHQSRCLDCNTRLTAAPPAGEPPPEAQGRHAAGIVAARGPEGDTYAIADHPSLGGRRCPGCGAALGEQAVLCVQCGYDFRLGKARTTLVEKGEGETPREQLRRQAASLPQVLRGLTLHAARILLSLLATALILGLTLYAATRRGVPTPEQVAWLELGLLGGVGVWLLGVLLGLVGSVLCLWLADTPARLLLALALMLDLATLPVGIVAALLGWTALLSWAMGLGSWVLFLVFLVRLSGCIDRPSEAREARTILVYGLLLVTIPASLAAMAILSRDPRSVGVVFVYLMPVFVILYFWVQILLIRLLETLRGSVRQQIDEARREGERRPPRGAAP